MTTNTELLRLVTRSIGEQPDQWTVKTATPFFVMAEDLHAGVVEVSPGRYRIEVSDADRRDATSIVCGGPEAPDDEIAAMAALHAALEPWRERARETARQSLVDRINRSLGNDAPAREAAVERLTQH